jgi:hypothetical protein
MPTRTAPEIELPPDAATADDHSNPRRRRRDRDEEESPPDVGMLVQPEPRHDLDKMILHPEVKTDILAGLRALEIRADLDRIWNLSSIQPQQGRCILNFYGPPGTGKTRAALGIALRLGKPLYQVDYSAVISKYLVVTPPSTSKQPLPPPVSTTRCCSLMKLTACFPSASPPANLAPPASTRTATA